MHLLDQPARTGAPSYAKCLEASRRVRWDIERDVIRGRDNDPARWFLPDGLSKADELACLGADERRLLSQIQARTYAGMFGLIEQAIAAKTRALALGHEAADPVACEALSQFTEGRIKHQALFARLAQIAAPGHPAGYTFVPEAGALAQAVLAHSSWAALALMLGIEIFTLAHYRASIEPRRPAQALDPLWADVLLLHWKEESQHAIVDELEWRREHARLDDAGRERGVTDLLSLVGIVDGLLKAQAAADATYFMRCCGRAFDATQAAKVHDLVRRAYRWQYIVSGLQEPRFVQVMKDLVTPAQGQRIAAALRPLVQHAMG